MSAGDSPLKPNLKYSKLATDAQVQKAAKNLTAHGMETVVVNSKEEALKAVLKMIPEHAEVFDVSSKTVEAIGLWDVIDKSGNYDSVKGDLGKLKQEGKAKEQRRLGAAPDYIVGSVHAVTEDGQVMISSATGSQLAGYASGAERVIWVIGAQKIVATMAEAFKRIEEYTFPLEDARARKAYGMGSGINKILIVNREAFPKRISVVIVKEALGF
jgi:L-lactate utilization protein LutC